MGATASIADNSAVATTSTKKSIRQANATSKGDENADKLDPGSKPKRVIDQATLESITNKINDYINTAFDGEDKRQHSLFRNLLSDPEATKIFQKFLQSECAEENLDFFQAIDTIKQTAAQSKNDKTKVEGLTQNLVSTFFSKTSDENIDGAISSRLYKNIQTQLMYKNRTKDEEEGLIEDLEKAQGEIVFLISMNILPKFLKTRPYREYMESKKKLDPHLADVTLIHDKHSSPKAPSNNAGENAPAPSKSLRLVGDSVDRDFMYTPQGSWLNGLFAASEALPICISLATARQDRRGFPLIHVNHVFESTTGYSRSEIIGSNCRFLQKKNVPAITPAEVVSDEEKAPADAVTTPAVDTPATASENDDSKDLTESEPESIAQLSKALATSQPVKVCITNFKRDGTPFVNLLAMKPIYDEKGEYRYVVGVQFDIGRDTNNTSMLQLAEMMLKTIPNVIYSGQDE